MLGNFLHSILKDRNANGVRQASLATGAALFSGLNVMLLGLFQPAGLVGIATAILVSALTLTAIVAGLQRLLLSVWAKPVLGQWVYHSSSGNWGLANLDIRGGDLRYTVQLYHTEEDTLAAVRQEPGYASRCFATVTSIGVTYQNDKVELIYKIDDTAGGYAPRSGMLTLSPLSRQAMKGYWKSDILGSEPNRGVLDMHRPRQDRSRHVG